MITIGRQFHYTARRGKLARRCGQLVTVLAVQKWQILVRFPDGTTAYIAPRFLKELATS